MKIILLLPNVLGSEIKAIKIVTIIIKTINKRIIITTIPYTRISFYQSSLTTPIINIKMTKSNHYQPSFSKI